MKKIIFSLLMFLAFAHFSYAEGDIIVSNAWVREAPPGATVSAAYMTLNNKSDQADKLTAITSNAAENVEIHISKVDEKGVAKMERVYMLELPVGEMVLLEPGGMHIMLIGLNGPLEHSVTFDLSFEMSGDVRVEVPVKSTKKKSEMHHH